MPAGAHQWKFFVYIVESPSAPDLYHGRSEGHLVAQAIGLDLIPCVTRTAINPEAFIAALRIGLPEAMSHLPDRIPILHISAHGGSNGIQLSSGTEIGWHHLRQLLLPINEGLEGTLLLCMSACEGYAACRMAMDEGEGPHPYLAMVGNYGKPTWSDTAVAYSAFYHLLARGYFIPEAVEAMKAASGDGRWAMETAEQLKRSYMEYIREVEPGQARRELESAAQGDDISPDAKALEE